MGVEHKLEAGGKTLTITVEGRFDFASYQPFREAYEQAPETVEEYVVDLGSAEYLDSSALGLLLMLREHAGGDDSRIQVVNCSADLRRILTIANFHRLFQIE